MTEKGLLDSDEGLLAAEAPVAEGAPEEAATVAETQPWQEAKWVFPALVTMASMVVISLVVSIYALTQLWGVQDRVGEPVVAEKPLQVEAKAVDSDVQEIVLKEMAVSLANKAVSKVLIVVIAVDVNKDADLARLIGYEAAVKDTVITILSSKMSYGLNSSESRDRLKDELKDAINETVRGIAVVKDLRFQKFFIQ
ncbi:MAG: flagellar basal body-associated FliL family protein [Zetaproteobacteria bacterium]|nr:flagellar basal body-associated FliL family protein [Zetaproteobacteria bacterium]